MLEPDWDPKDTTVRRLLACLQAALPGVNVQYVPVSSKNHRSHIAIKRHGCLDFEVLLHWLTDTYTYVTVQHRIRLYRCGSIGLGIDNGRIPKDVVDNVVSLFKEARDGRLA